MIYQCPKCGLSKSDSAMGSVLPQCMCHWQTQPPQRQWVGLTDDDCFEALKAIDSEAKRLPLGFSMFAANIQAKLKEKNT